MSDDKKLEAANHLLVQIAMEREITLAEAGELAVWLHASPAHAAAHGHRSGESEVGGVS